MFRLPEVEAVIVQAAIVCAHLVRDIGHHGDLRGQQTVSCCRAIFSPVSPCFNSSIPSWGAGRLPCAEHWPKNGG